MVKDAVEVYERYIKPLSVPERLRLMEITARELAAASASSIEARPKRSILALRGLGKEIWQGVDAQAYVDTLRKEWDQRL